MLRAIHEIRPDWVIGENVAGILTMVQPGQETEVGSQSTLFSESEPVFKRRQQYVVETICRDLEREGYSVQPILIPACAVGAPHRRDRVWFIAHRKDPGLQAERTERQPAGTARDHPCDASSYSAGYGNTPSGESPQMETTPCAIPAQPTQRGEEAQWAERLLGFLWDAAAYSGSQRCRCGAVMGKNDRIIVTPKGKIRKINQKGHVWSVGLGRMAELLPTPTARDWKGAASLESLEKRGRIPEKNSLPDFFARTGKSFQLNPLFVAEMMGFPLGWTVSPLLSEEKSPSKDTETPSSPR